MAAFSTIAGIAGAALSTAGSVKGSIDAKNDAKKREEEQRRALEAENSKLAAEEKKISDQQAFEKKKKKNLLDRDTAQNRQGRKSAGSKGFGSTLLTGSQGVTGEGNVATKTLLGA